MIIRGILVLTLCLASTPSFAITAAQKCEAAKLKFAGQYVFCRLKADAKAAKTGITADYAKCDATLAQRWEKAESAAHGGCATVGDQQSEQSILTAHARESAARLSGAPRFADNGDGTIVDRESGLQWEKKVGGDNLRDLANLHDVENDYAYAGSCSINTAKRCQPTTAGAALCETHLLDGGTGCDQCSASDGTCVLEFGVDTVWTWLAALNGANFAGHSDWRLPTRTEQQGIYDYTDAVPPGVDPTFHGVNCSATCLDLTDPTCSCTMVGNGYWTVSPVAYPYWGEPNAWAVWGDGGVVNARLTATVDARAVRSLP